MRPAGAGYVPTLDGWRAVAVLAVIAYHDQLRRIGPVSDSFLHANGALGVDLFFAISGLLICGRLLDEETARGHISLRDFYVRRACRILPPVLAYLAAIGVLGLTHSIQLPVAAWLSSLLFVGNYYYVHVRYAEVSLYTNHLWSLALEEHFYLLIPGLLCWLPRRRVTMLAGLTIASLGYAMWIYTHPVLWDAMGGSASGFRTEVRIHALLFPALLAVLLRNARFRRLCTVAIPPAAVVFLLVVVAMNVLPAIGLRWLTLAVIPVGFPLMVLATVLHPQGLLARALEWRPLRWVGRLSYSLYLWQQLFFIDMHESCRATGVLGAMQGKWWSLLPAMVLAAASYYLLERPFIRLGHRLAPPVTPGHADESAAQPG